MASSDRPAGERSALVLFGSETGNAQDVAEEIGNICERLRLSTLVCELNSIDIVGPKAFSSISLDASFIFHLRFVCFFIFSRLILCGRGNYCVTLLLFSSFPPQVRVTFPPMLNRFGGV
jgi:hypothetical protein